MNQFQDKSQPSGQPGLAELLTRYLHGQTGVHEAGLAAAVTGEVVPYEAAPSQTADPKLAAIDSDSGIALNRNDPIPLIGP